MLTENRMTEKIVSSNIPLRGTAKNTTFLPITIGRANLKESAVDVNTPVLHETTIPAFKKLPLYQKVCHRQRATILVQLKKLKYLQKRISTLEGQLSNSSKTSASIYKVFNYDQVSSLEKIAIDKSKKFGKWTDATIFKALRLKFSCGIDGYEEVLKQNIPLPSEKTFYRRLHNMKFESGVLHQVFEFLETKVDFFGNNDRDCCLILEEMEILSEDSSRTEIFDGEITIPNQNGTATHLLVVILAGVTTGWKQIVAYYFTNGSVDNQTFEDIIHELSENIKTINLNLVSITANMVSGSNQSSWQALNNIIDHSLDHQQPRIFADVYKLFSKLKMVLQQKQIIMLPESFIDKYKLPTNYVSLHHISELVALQTVYRFRLVPKCLFVDLLPQDFEQDIPFKSKSRNVRKVDVSEALKLVSELDPEKSEYLTTSWFLDILERWFEIMTSKYPITALSRCKEEDYRRSIKLMFNFSEIIQSIQVEDELCWKPVQTAAVTTTKSMLCLQNILLNQKNCGYLLTGRFFSNSLEMLFNVMKNKKIKKNAQNIEHNLKILCVAQYMKCLKNLNDEDDKSIFQRCNFIDLSKKDNQEENYHFEKIFVNTFDGENIVTNGNIHTGEVLIKHEINEQDMSCDEMTDETSSSET